MSSRSADVQREINWRLQNVISNFVKMGLRRAPYAFAEQGIAMLRSVLHSSTAIQVNIGIIRAFVEIRRLASCLPTLVLSADVAQLRKDFEELKLDIEDILHDQNDINEGNLYIVCALRIDFGKNIEGGAYAVTAYTPH